MICYQVTNVVSGKVYIGLTTMALAERWRRHVGHALAGRGYALHDAIRKYGVENFTIEELAHSLTRDRDDLAELERLLIAQADSIAPGGYNLTAGGDGVGGCESTNRKISASLTGKKLSDEHRASMKAAAVGRVTGPPTEETKAKISASQKGKPGKKHSEETKMVLRMLRYQQLEALRVAKEAILKASENQEVSS